MAAIFIISIVFTGLLSAGSAWVFFGKFGPASVERSTLLTIIEVCIELVVIVGTPFLVIWTSYDADKKAYPDGHGWFLPLAVLVGYAAWRLTKSGKGRSRDKAASTEKSLRDHAKDDDVGY